MMTTLRNRGWLLPCAAVGALALALPQRSLSADDARDWLEKMNRALATRNYDGTFFHLSEGRVETMRIVHRVKGGRVTERLLSLDGSGREFVRNNDELTCYLPDQRTVLVEPRQDRGPFLGSLPQFGADVNEFYRIESLPASRVLGRAARVIAVNPKDQYRFGYRLWLDENTAMPLKTQLCDARGQVIEQILFARLEMPESISDSELTPAVHTEGMRWVRQGPSHDTAPPALTAYRASELPPGFRLTISGAQTLGGATVPATPPRVLGRTRHRVGIRRSATRPKGRCRRCPERAERSAPDAGIGPSRFRICLFHRGARPPSHRSRRGSGTDGGVHRALGQVVQRRSAAPVAALIMGFLLYSRPGCGLCEELLAELAALPAARGYPIEVIDVDGDAVARARFGHKIPVLLFGGELVCRGRLDVEEVHKALAHHG